ncbi:MAG TPA: TetR/AcrR family transcriptional regulator [Euzebya sp.]|nr:TetR/AcrR family transcriptional regulator [Euzebya sp.]
MDRLVAAGTHLFANQGYERTTVQEVVVAAGVTKGAMYHYFTSKDDLLYEIYHRILAMQSDRLRAVAGGEGPIYARLREAAVDVIATTVDNFDDLTVVSRCMHLLAPLQQRAVRAERRRYHEAFRDMVVAGQRAGVFASDVDADLVVDFFFGAVHHLPAWFRPGGRLSGQALGQAYAALLLRALTAPDPQKRHLVWP